METSVQNTTDNRAVQNFAGGVQKSVHELSSEEEVPQTKEVKVRGRKPKATKSATKTERQEILRQRVISLKDDLEAAGFGPLLKVTGPVQDFGETIPETKKKRSIAQSWR